LRSVKEDEGVSTGGNPPYRWRLPMQMRFRLNSPGGAYRVIWIGPKEPNWARQSRNR
jgi:hypothetical protein